MVAHWRFDETRGSSTPDDSGAGNDGTFGIPLQPFAEYRFPRAIVAPGRIGNALEFQKRQWVLGENSACFASEQVSVMAWVWLETVSGAPTIAAKSAWPLDGWWLMTTNMPTFGSERYLELGIAWGSGWGHVKSGYQLPLREWHHVAVTMDNALQEVQFFIDGKPYGEKHTDVHKWLVNYSTNFMVGDYDKSGRWPWHGKIDDVRVYNRVVSAEEVISAFRQAPM